MKFLKDFKKKFNKNKTIKAVKKYINNLDKNELKNILYMILPFLLIEVFIVIIGIKISYVNHRFLAPVLFTMCWIVFFVGISLSFKKSIGKWIYLISIIPLVFMFFVNAVYFNLTKNFFDFSLVESASEGSPYILNTLLNCKFIVYIALIILLISVYLGFKHIPESDENDYRKLGKVLCIFVLLHLFTPITLGRANKDLTWNSWKNARNIYNSFNDANKSMKTSGFFEYTFRNFYVTFLKTEEQESEEDIEFLDSAFANKKTTKNDYTSKLKGKNLILVQLEGIDKWLLNKEDTPTLYKLMNEGISFDKHYSFYSGGGSTFNSEFAVNTGFITPLSFTKNVYSFNKNNFPNSLPKLFKEKGYSVNAFHMNTGEYYSRTVNYKTWGYDNYYGLIDIDKYDDKSYMLDRELLLNEKFEELLFPSEGNFVDYIITYSTHMPFDNTSGVCKLLYELDNGEDAEFVQMSEEECARRQARETDYFIELLLQKLKEKKLYDNTALVIFADHYLYTLNDQTILDKYKTTSNNLINNTPWFIWYNGVKSKKITKVTSQLNILPTVLNMYGITYSVNDYIAEDALGKKYKGIAFFSDYSWYDGTVYVENGVIKNGKKMNEDKLEEMNEYVSYLAKKNDLTLKYNYFKKLGSE